MEQFFDILPYSLTQAEKINLLLPYLKKLTKRHASSCAFYERFLKATTCDLNKINALESVPFLPVRAFKELELKSIPGDKIFKLMTSSGTTGQRPSKIYLDKENAVLQQKVLLRLLGDFIGAKRKPMLVIDTPSIMRDRIKFGTRSATLIGLTYAAKDLTFALNDDFSLNKDIVADFINKYGESDFLVFGFTYMVWQYFFEALKNEEKFDLKNAALLTTGGWKKLEDKAVSHDEFKRVGREILNIGKFVDHYGMAEQTGAVYIECEYGHLHASVFSDVIIRRSNDFSPCDIGEAGYIEVLSSLPHSYPGHALLTEDVGMIQGIDDCPCGRLGKYIKVIGRMKRAEIRGCSDTR